MGVNLHKIKKWTNMLCGNSVYHVNQNEGQFYSKTNIQGYYNNLMEKVTRFGTDGLEIPKIKVDSGEEIEFCIAIFQYGLGAYDLYIQTGDLCMLEKAIACAEWAVVKQKDNGGWDAFSFENPDSPYSSMAQGEGTSLLLRVYKETKDEKFFRAAQKAIEFMLTPIEQGGTTLYEGKDVFFYEYTYEPLILNGWIFSFWGLWDYCLVVEDSQKVNILKKTLNSMVKTLPKYDNGYWSMYDADKRLCSPFYHSLHIAQLNVMYDLTGQELFKVYAEKWSKYQKNFWKPKKAFIKKAIQKILE